jgi:hypothetical protein
MGYRRSDTRGSQSSRSSTLGATSIRATRISSSAWRKLSEARGRRGAPRRIAADDAVRAVPEADDDDVSQLSAQSPGGRQDDRRFDSDGQRRGAKRREYCAAMCSWPSAILKLAVSSLPSLPTSHCWNSADKLAAMVMSQNPGRRLHAALRLAEWPSRAWLAHLLTRDSPPRRDHGESLLSIREV